MRPCHSSSSGMRSCKLPLDISSRYTSNQLPALHLTSYLHVCVLCRRALGCASAWALSSCRTWAWSCHRSSRAHSWMQTCRWAAICMDCEPATHQAQEPIEHQRVHLTALVLFVTVIQLTAIHTTPVAERIASFASVEQLVHAILPGRSVMMRMRTLMTMWSTYRSATR